MVVRGPGITAASTFDWIGSNVDVAPTFLSLAGVNPLATQPPMDGHSFAHKLVNPSAEMVPDSTVQSVQRELAALEKLVTDSGTGGAAGGPAAWRDHHWVEYNSLGSVTRTGHLVDDPRCVTPS